jgi:hypothetical protein
LQRDGKPLPEDARFGVRGAVIEQWTAFHAAQARSALVIPKAVDTALAAYNGTFLGLTAPPGAGGYDPALISHEDPAMPLSQAFQAVVRAMRDALGIEPLTDATMDLFGVGPIAQRKADADKLRLAAIDVQVDVMTARARQRGED